jgi:formylglycine-generating enzyme required for sulfatase activity
LPDNLGLKETLAALRRGQGIPLGKKVVIVLDQFEQWLHAKKEEENTELVQALRQCDGSRVQCLVMVRDDFWMAATRFMRDLEVRLLEGQNSAAADLFDLDHARKVLAVFGRAFGKLPENPSDTSKDQKEFLKQAVSGLAQEGKVISVRLSLFAEMMKGKAWTPASLKAVGGTEGVGVTFLEETFSAATAPPEHRYHQKAARSVLKALLPESGTDIKGHMRTYVELLAASGYDSRPKDFDDLIRILDGEIRLITPTDPEGKEEQGEPGGVSPRSSGEKYYQLTHDYLVHSLRDWLTRKQKETGRGRAELPLLSGEIDKKLPAELPSSDDNREKLAKRQANAAVALLRMNQPEKVWPLLKHRPDPRARSYLIHRLSPLGADAGAILKRFDAEPDITIRRALLLSLGEFGDKELPPEARKALLPKLQDIYRREADPGLHAAAEWLLRTWQQQAWLKQVNEEWAKDKEQRAERLQRIGQLLSKDKEKTPPQWYVNGQGQTMVVIPGPVEFVMGSPRTEAERRPDESQHKKRIGRTFALAAAPVTKEQFLKFRPGFSHSEFRRYPAPTCPIGGVDWYEAAAYCNWLSEQEGIPPEQWCYETNAQRLLQEKANAAVMLLLQRHPLAAAASSSFFLGNRRPQVTALRKNYLSLTGYRLPTEAEMEYATRAGAVTSRYYGETEEQLPKYAWYFKNSQEKTWPVGSLKPNDLGLFDALGNVYALCQERYKSYPQDRGRGEEDIEDIYSINTQEGRELRGGSFGNRASLVRCALRVRIVPEDLNLTVGFRPARTYR